MKGFCKTILPVIWRSNRKAWMTRDIFQTWFVHDFCPGVKTYCEKHNFEKKALLLLDSAPGHPVDLDDSSTGIKVEVVFLPPNTTSLLQPMDQGTIAAFKAYYVRFPFTQI